MELLPEMSWEVVAIEDDLMRISVTLTSEDGVLPEGEASFRIDGETMETLSTQLESQQIAPFTFTDNESKTAEVHFSYRNGQNTLSETKTIQRKENIETVETDLSEWSSSVE